MNEWKALEKKSKQQWACFQTLGTVSCSSLYNFLWYNINLQCNICFVLNKCQMNEMITCKHIWKLRIYHQQPHNHASLPLYFSVSSLVSIIVNDFLESLNKSDTYKKAVEFITKYEIRRQGNAEIWWTANINGKWAQTKCQASLHLHNNMKQVSLLPFDTQLVEDETQIDSSRSNSRACA